MKIKSAFVLFISFVVYINICEASTVYTNDFSDPSDINGFTKIGDGSFSIHSGQLKADVISNFGRINAMVDTNIVFSPEYISILAQNTNPVSWSFNVSNEDGAFNNTFQFVLSSTYQDPYNVNAVGYYFGGGGYVGNRMGLKRFDHGMGGGQEFLIDVTDGLGTLPYKGSIRIVYDPRNDRWSLFGQTGTDYLDPTSVNNLLGSTLDSQYTNIDASYMGFGGKTSGVDYFDNIQINLLPLPSAICITKKLKAATRLCTSYVKCYARKMKNSDIDLARSVALPESKFEWRWDKAEDNAAKKELDCTTASDSAIKDTIFLGLGDIYDQISAGLDLGEKKARKLGRFMMKAAGKRCRRLLNAERKNIKNPDSDKLNAAISRANAKFKKSWEKAEGNAIKKGLVYTGPSMSDVEAMIDNLVADVLDGFY